MRTPFRFIISVAILPLLASCSPARTALPAEEVLKNAAMSAPSLQSADVSATATLTQLLPGFAPVKLVLDGTVSDGGQQMMLNIDASTTHAGVDDPSRLRGSMAVGGEHEVYLRFDAIEGPVLEAIMGPEAKTAWIGTWWKLPGAAADATNPAITPDPALLRMQAEVLSLVRDRGMERMDGADVYHYDVKIDAQKLRAYLQAVVEARGEPVNAAQIDAQVAAIDGSGEVWIDADSFILRRVQWTLHDPTTTDGFSMDVDAHITNINAAKPITLPVDALPFPMNVDQFLPEQTP